MIYRKTQTYRIYQHPTRRHCIETDFEKSTREIKPKKNKTKRKEFVKIFLYNFQENKTKNNNNNNKRPFQTRYIKLAATIIIIKNS